SAKYGRLEMCVTRDKEMEAIFQAFASGQYGVLLVGENGVGKRTIIEGLAQLMVKEEVPKFFQDKRLAEIDLSRLISGASPAEAQERLLSCINEALISGNVILYIENLQNIMGISSGGEGSLDLSEVLANAIKSQGLYCLATINRESYTKHVEDKSLGDIMTTVGVSEPVNDQAIQMIESKVGFWEGKHKVYFSYDAIEQAVKMTSRYFNDKFLPEKAINILTATAVKVAQRRAKDGRGPLCSKEEVAEVISDITKIPVNKITQKEGEKLLHLEAVIHERMIDQEEAVSAVASSLRRARTELRESKRPIASFLFLGPTGVGKTELAKSVADVYFGDENAMVRLDMSEYQLAGSVNKMIGDADGTLGYLTEAVRKKPFSLVLLDEIEKSHPDVLNLFLQMMDDGRLTDGQGRTINFTNSIIIATSNIGALYIQDEVNKNTDIEIIKRNLIENQINKVMRPELINRFDGVIVFKPLTLSNVYDIAKLLLKKLATNLEIKGISLRVSEDGLRKVAELGYDPQFGARPLRRVIQDKVENQIANIFLAGNLKRRDTVVINNQGEIEIEKGANL
nr:ATP-dependent Clp protease ATP-binding subunit [Planctomycetota bacterium]